MVQVDGVSGLGVVPGRQPIHDVSVISIGGRYSELCSSCQAANRTVSGHLQVGVDNISSF